MSDLQDGGIWPDGPEPDWDKPLAKPEHVHGPWIVIYWERHTHGYKATKVACSSCLEQQVVAFDKSNVPTVRN